MQRVSLKPVRNAASMLAPASGVPAQTNPTTGTPRCCARAASDHAATDPSPAMKSRRRNSIPRARLGESLTGSRLHGNGVALACTASRCAACRARKRHHRRSRSVPALRLVPPAKSVLKIRRRQLVRQQPLPAAPEYADGFRSGSIAGRAGSPEESAKLGQQTPDPCQPRRLYGRRPNTSRNPGGRAANRVAR
jgi:hypothetical protein